MKGPVLATKQFVFCLEYILIYLHVTHIWSKYSLYSIKFKRYWNVIYSESDTCNQSTYYCYIDFTEYQFTLPLCHSRSCRSNVQIMNNKNYQKLLFFSTSTTPTASHSYLGHNTPLVVLGKLHSHLKRKTPIFSDNVAVRCSREFWIVFFCMQ